MVLLLQALGLRGVLDLLGVRHTTVGSVDTLPPSRDQPMAAFNRLHRSADSSENFSWERVRETTKYMIFSPVSLLKKINFSSQRTWLKSQKVNVIRALCSWSQMREFNSFRESLSSGRESEKVNVYDALQVSRYLVRTAVERTHLKHYGRDERSDRTDISRSRDARIMPE